MLSDLRIDADSAVWHRPPVETRGQKLARLRVEAGFPTQASALDALGMDAETLSNYENDAPRKMQARTRKRFADAYGVPFEEIPSAPPAPERSGTEHSVADLSNRSLRTDATSPTVPVSGSAIVLPDSTELGAYLFTRLGVHGLFVITALASVLESRRDEAEKICDDVARHIKDRWGGTHARPKAKALQGRR